jgi:glyoxylase-like metal-dependent hydrolase (beta-lactamase superfamily II)
MEPEPRTGWFATRTLHPGVHLIAEPFHVNSYLVEGTETRVHIDTGLGVADIRAAGDALSERSPWAANTHYHFDHIGGNGAFDEIAIHESGVDLAATQKSDEVLDGYRSWAKRMYERWPSYRESDEGYFALTDDVSSLRPFPEAFDFDSWSVPPSVATRPFSDGDVLDLGRRQLRVIHTPGHTPDSVCFLDEAEGLLFTGDTVNSGPILVTDPLASAEDFARSARRLVDEVISSVRVAYMAHGARFSAEPGFLREVADGFEAVVEGRAPLVDVVDALEGDSRLATFARFSIVMPPAPA